MPSSTSSSAARPLARFPIAILTVTVPASSLENVTAPTSGARPVSPSASRKDPEFAAAMTPVSTNAETAASGTTSLLAGLTLSPYAARRPAPAHRPPTASLDVGPEHVGSRDGRLVAEG